MLGIVLGARYAISGTDIGHADARSPFQSPVVHKLRYLPTPVPYRLYRGPVARPRSVLTWRMGLPARLYCGRGVCASTTPYAGPSAQRYCISLAYGPMLLSYAPAMPCPVLTQRIRYKSGAELSQRSTETPSGLYQPTRISPRVCYVLSGTNLPYVHTRDMRCPVLVRRSANANVEY
eukprot:3938041-Rhodomonas_salina.1